MRPRTLPLALALVVLAACGKQSLGEPCSTKAGNSGSDDCEDGLVCVSGGLLNHAGYDVCCPPDTATSAVVGSGACNKVPPTINADASTDAMMSTTGGTTGTTSTTTTAGTGGATSTTGESTSSTGEDASTEDAASTGTTGTTGTTETTGATGAGTSGVTGGSVDDAASDAPAE